MRALVFIFFAVAIGSAAYGKVRLNSMCYVLDHEGAKIEGERTTELFEIASVSKVATAYWALKELGPSFHHRTRVHITRISTDLYDVHVEGSRDPFWGRQLTHFLFAELNRLKITRIRQLTFDENLIFRWSVVTNFIDSFAPTPEEIAKALRRRIQNLRNEYSQTRQEAAAVGIPLARTLTLDVQNIEPLARAHFQASANTRTYVFKSAPLYRYLKEMNRVSNNHVADHIFDNLGGVKKFNDFISQDMHLDADDIQFVNGSGNSLVGKDVDGLPIKEYNKATCETVLKIILKLDEELKKQKLELKDIMAVSGSETSTLNPRYDSIKNILAGKTGTVDPAITLAGMISTAKGNLYFAIFTGTEGAADWGNARDVVRSKVFDLMGQHGGGKSFKYTSRPFLPFDRNSALSLETPRLARVP